ncbi:MAG: caspase family protein [Bacteroidales bacterium]|jgi:WD40 repeat protein
MKLFKFYSLYFLLLLVPDTVNAQPAFSVKRILNEANHQVLSASYSLQGKYIVTSGSDNNIIIWNARTGIIYRTLAGLRSFPVAAVFDEEKDILASAGGNDTIILWHPSLSASYAVLRGHKGKINAISISSDGRFLASAGTDHKVILYRLADNKILFILTGHETAVNDVSFSPDGTMLVSAGADKKLILWSTGQGKMSVSKDVHTAPVRCVRFSRDGKSIASGGDEGNIIISDVTGLVPIGTLAGHKGPVLSIDYSSDGKYLISGGQDQIFLLWDVQTGNIIKQSEEQEQSVVSVSFNPASPDFVTACHHSEIFCTWTVSGNALSSLENLSSDKSVPMADLMEKQDNSKDISKAFEGIEGISEKKEINENKDLSKKPSQTREKKTKKIIKLEEVAVMGKSEMAEEMTPPLSAPASTVSPDVPVIEVFSPSVAFGEATSDQSSLYLIGRVTNAEGTSVILINKKPVRLSEAGVFEFRMDLIKGYNPVDIIAVNNKGRMNEMGLQINSTAEAVAAGPATGTEGKYYALIIGINDYRSPDIPSLDNPIKDAASLYNVLSTKYTFDTANIFFLRNPTLNEIITTLDGLVGKITSNDNLLIFYAGHGYWDDKGKVGYWFPSDATKGSTVNWFRNSTLRDFIGSIQSKHTLLIADACFSGAIFKTRSGFSEAPQGVQQLYDLPSRKAMTSGILEVVPDESTFMKYLVEKLSSNTEKFFPSELLFSNLKTAVMNNSNNVPQYGVIQNVGDEGGDFIFVKR